MIPSVQISTVVEQKLDDRNVAGKACSVHASHVFYIFLINDILDVTSSVQLDLLLLQGAAFSLMLVATHVRLKLHVKKIILSACRCVLRALVRVQEHSKNFEPLIDASDHDCIITVSVLDAYTRPVVQ